MNEQFPLFVLWYAVLDWILDRVEQFPRGVRFTVSDRIARLALQVMEGIVSAIHTKTRGHILRDLDAYMETLRVYMRLSMDRKYISMRQYEYISGEINRAGRMLGGWRKAAKGGLDG